MASEAVLEMLSSCLEVDGGFSRAEGRRTGPP